MESTPTRSTRLTTADMILIALAAWILLFGGWETLRTLFTGGTIPGVKGTTTPLSSTPQITILGAGSTNGTNNPGPLRVPPVNRSRSGSSPEVDPSTPTALPTVVPVPETVQGSTVVYCEDVLPGQNIHVPDCQWRDIEQARRDQQHIEQEALQVWDEMVDVCAEVGCAPAEGVPTAETPTECVNPQTPRAIATCRLIEKGVIHPKG